MRSATETYHIEPGAKGGWQVRHNDLPRVLASFATQKEAIDWLHGHVEKKKGTEFLLHRRDGWARAISGRLKAKEKAAPKLPPTPGRPVVFATDHEADEAAARVFHRHGRLLAELAK